jgi:hypothetical protein
VYLISYFRDDGALHSMWCQMFPAYFACAGHNGDSEAVVVDVYYWAARQHWTTDSIHYSEHGDWVSAYRSARAYATDFVWYEGPTPHLGHVQYYEHLGAAPLVWVSRGQHANYFDSESCNSGGAFDVDTCEDNDRYLG